MILTNDELKQIYLGVVNTCTIELVRNGARLDEHRRRSKQHRKDSHEENPV